METKSPPLSLSAKILTKTTTIALNNGVLMPMFGFGSYLLDGIKVVEPVTSALKEGYIHIDTAAIYRNEVQIGQILKEMKVDRNSLFIASKLQPADQGYESTLQAFEKSLSNLGLEYLDLYLMHWPGVAGLKRNDPKCAAIRLDSWRAMEELYQKGKVRAIGVSNFTVAHLTHLIKNCKIPPSVNQVEFHPFLTQQPLLKFCKENNIVLEAYSSLGTGANSLLENEVVLNMAKKYNKTAAQVLLRWGLDQGVPVIPKSSHPDRINENANLFDFQLTSEDIEKLISLNQDKHYCWDPTEVP